MAPAPLAGGHSQLSRLRLRARIALGVALAAVLAFVVAWALTPSVDDAQLRVQRDAALRGAVVLGAKQVPRLLADAIVATEDERFWQHHGIDYIGLTRALIYDVGHFCVCEGGSTITQQLVKELYLGGYDRGPEKFEDILLAFKLELRLTKQEILADYLTLVPTGPTLYGVANAACAYFHRPLADLDLAEYALLAGLPQAPSAYEPGAHPQLALQRRGQVLSGMAGDGYISRARAAAAQAEPLLPAPPAGARTC